jgi:hypothetical protein
MSNALHIAYAKQISDGNNFTLINNTFAEICAVEETLFTPGYGRWLQVIPKLPTTLRRCDIIQVEPPRRVSELAKYSVINTLYEQLKEKPFICGVIEDFVRGSPIRQNASIYMAFDFKEQICNFLWENPNYRRVSNDTWVVPDATNVARALEVKLILFENIKQIPVESRWSYDGTAIRGSPAAAASIVLR